MIKFTLIKDKKGVSLVELIVVISIIGILAALGIPQYGRFVARNNVRKATNDLLQNMRSARTMAIKENRPYLITFNEGQPNSYRIGFDGTPIPNNSLLDAEDVYGTGPVRVVNMQTLYGNEIIFGTATGAGPDEPTACPACSAIAGSTVAFGAAAAPVRLVFLPDGTVDATGSAFITHITRQFTYMLRISYLSGKFDLWKWDGDNQITAPPIVVNCTTPRRYCGWTELR